MTNSIIKDLKLLINFGIDDNENITREDRIVRMQNFREKLSIEKYDELFNRIQNCLLNDEVSLEEKDAIICNFIDFIRCYIVLEDSVSKLPPLLFEIYNVHMTFNRLIVYLEMISSYDVPSTMEFETILLEYFDFLENPENEFYIHNCYSKIDKFNKMVLEFLKKKDYDNRKFEDVINNPELISTFKNKINELSKMRG